MECEVVMTNFKKIITMCLGLALMMLGMSWILSGNMGSSIYKLTGIDKSVNSILNGIVLENYDYISGKALLKNEKGQEIVYDPKNNGSLEYLTGYRVVSLEGDTIRLTPVDTEALYKVMPNVMLNISNIKSQNDLVKLTDDNISKQFIDYLVNNKIDDKIKFVGYSTSNKTLTYNNLDEAKIVTLQLADDGFYKVAESEDIEASDSAFALSLVLVPIVAILLFCCCVILDASEDDTSNEDKRSSKVSLSK